MEGCLSDFNTPPMKRTTLLALPLVCVPLATLWALPDPAESAADWTSLQDDATPLQEAMGTLKEGQRGLKKLIDDPAANQRAMTELLVPMEEACLTAIRSELPLPEGVAAERAALLKVGYRRTMTQLLEQVLVMHEAALEKDGAALEAAYRALGLVKKAGHDEYQDL